MIESLNGGGETRQAPFAHESLTLTLDEAQPDEACMEWIDPYPMPSVAS